LQAAQLPLLQYRPVPQPLPLAAFPVSRHCEAPVVQVVVPTLQADGVQAMFAVQATQSPSLQTMPLPQLRPLGALPDSRPCEVPVVQLVVPVLQGLPVSHDTFAVQDEQVPLLHTRLVPQLVPLVTLRPVSVHSGVPVVQDRVPVWHRFIGVQA
jgi:hypothetical protein